MTNNSDDRVPEVSKQSKNSPDWTARIIAGSSLCIAVLTLLFGDNIFGRIYNYYSDQQPKIENKKLIEGIIAVLNILLAVYVLVDLRFIRRVRADDDDSVASKSFKQLLFGWKILWFTWILFYICLAFIWFSPAEFVRKYYLWNIADLLNMLNGFFFYYLFFVLDDRSVATSSEPNRARKFHHNLGITFVIGIIVFTVSWWFMPPEQSSESELVNKLVPAYIAVGMAFFFGRLDSHYLKFSRIVLAPLYLYAVIQLFWGRQRIAGNLNFDSERVTIFALALILKFTVFIILSKEIKKESFRQYFVDAEEGLRKSQGD